jgi:hypothetical protein
VGAVFTGTLTATFFDALLATAVFFVAISPLYPIFFVGCNATTTTRPRCRKELSSLDPTESSDQAQP